MWLASDRANAQPWFYSSSDTAADPGRFDLPAPHGTCYWALTAIAAILEATADPDALDPPTIVVSDLDHLTVWEAADVPAARTRRLADTTVASVPTLTGEIATIVPTTCRGYGPMRSTATAVPASATAVGSPPMTPSRCSGPPASPTMHRPRGAPSPPTTSTTCPSGSPPTSAQSVR